MSPKELENKIDDIVSKSDNGLIVLKNQIGQLIKQNEMLYEQVTKAQSWKIKAIDLILGAFIGSIVSLILSILFL